jgi:hypothetical protein
MRFQQLVGETPAQTAHGTYVQEHMHIVVTEVTLYPAHLHAHMQKNSC